MSHLRTFIRNDSELSFVFNLDPAQFMIQFAGFPGAVVGTLQTEQCLQYVRDFQPDIVLIFVGTCDIYKSSESPESVATQLYKLVEACRSVTPLRDIIVIQTLHRIPPSIPVKYPVDCHWFNARVDELNHRLHESLPDHNSKLWRLKGFWSEASQLTVYADDGTHLSPLGNRKLFNSVRAAIVTFTKTIDNE